MMNLTHRNTGRISVVLRCAIAAASLFLPAVTAQAEIVLPEPCAGAESWSVVSISEFPPMAITGDRVRNQGVTSDGDGWIFSATSTVERTDEDYKTTAESFIPLDVLVDPAYEGGLNIHYGNNHIGDLDTYDGIVYTAIEDDGDTQVGPIGLNTPRYTHPIIALFDAKTMLYTGEKHHLDPTILQEGVPWVAVDGPNGEFITGEYDLPHNRLNIYKLKTFLFDRFLDLHYSPYLGPGFHLRAVQGLKVYGSRYFYASSTGDLPGIYRIDIATGLVELAYPLPSELAGEVEGLAFRPMADGSLLHFQVNHDVDGAHYSRLVHMARTCGEVKTAPDAPATTDKNLGRFGGAMGGSTMLLGLALAGLRRRWPRIL